MPNPLDHLFTPPPKEGELPAVEDVTMGEEPCGLGFPGEVQGMLCPECKSSATMQLRQSKHGLFYGCENWPTCTATLGAHQDGRPKGIPGDKPTRKARVFAHRIFDRLWKKEGERPGRMTRSQAYAWMQKAMKLTASEVHIGMFDIEECRKLVHLVQKKFPGVRTAWDILMDDDTS